MFHLCMYDTMISVIYHRIEKWSNLTSFTDRNCFELWLLFSLFNFLSYVKLYKSEYYLPSSKNLAIFFCFCWKAVVENEYMCPDNSVCRNVWFKFYALFLRSYYIDWSIHEMGRVCMIRQRFLNKHEYLFQENWDQ